jgi:hypothetical protein
MPPALGKLTKEPLVPSIDPGPKPIPGTIPAAVPSGLMINEKKK